MKLTPADEDYLMKSTEGRRSLDKIAELETRMKKAARILERDYVTFDQVADNANAALKVLRG